MSRVPVFRLPIHFVLRLYILNVNLFPYLSAWRCHFKNKIHQKCGTRNTNTNTNICLCLCVCERVYEYVFLCLRDCFISLDIQLVCSFLLFALNIILRLLLWPSARTHTHTQTTYTHTLKDRKSQRNQAIITYICAFACVHS